MFKKGVCSRVGGGGGGSRRTTCSGQLAPSTIWIPGTELRPQAWQETPFLLSQLSGRPGHLLRSEVMLTVVEKSDGPQVLFFFF